MKVAIIGGGPAGLRAAEVAAGRGATVTVFDAKPSVGRKLLVAGRGGLNLTHGEDLADFISRYSGPAGFWQRAISAFTPADLREWAGNLGIETFEQRTGRVYPREMKAAPLLRRWVDRLRGLGVAFEMNHRWSGLVPGSPHRLDFSVHGESRSFFTDAAVLALGGASWPITGSDGQWTSILRNLGIGVHPLVPANCGWEACWSADLLARAEGQPLKNLVVRAGDHQVRGELLVTSYGLEGGAIYQLGPDLRTMDPPRVHIDFKPDFSAADLARKGSWKLSAAAEAVLRHGMPDGISREDLAWRAKDCPIDLTGPRPMEEAISSAGGVAWEEIDECLMLRKLPGIHVAGEMIDWEAPTGGYLMQGCFATGAIAGMAAATA